MRQIDEIIEEGENICHANSQSNDDTKTWRSNVETIGRIEQCKRNNYVNQERRDLNRRIVCTITSQRKTKKFQIKARKEPLTSVSEKQNF